MKIRHQPPLRKVGHLPFDGPGAGTEVLLDVGSPQFDASRQFGQHALLPAVRRPLLPLPFPNAGSATMVVAS